MTRTAYRDFPAASLVAEVRRQHPTTEGRVAALAKACGTSGASAARWLDEGLTAWQADRAACALGLHPSDLWGDLWHAMALLDDLVAAEHARLDRWVRAYVARHCFDTCSPRRQSPLDGARRGRASACVPTGAAPSG